MPTPAALTFFFFAFLRNRGICTRIADSRRPRVSPFDYDDGYAPSLCLSVCLLPFLSLSLLCLWLRLWPCLASVVVCLSVCFPFSLSLSCVCDCVCGCVTASVTATWCPARMREGPCPSSHPTPPPPLLSCLSTALFPHRHPAILPVTTTADPQINHEIDTVPMVTMDPANAFGESIGTFGTMDELGISPTARAEGVTFVQEERQPQDSGGEWIYMIYKGASLFQSLPPPFCLPL